MKLSTYMTEEFIFLDIDSNDIDSLIKKSIDELAKVDKKLVSIEKEVTETVLKREHEISTAIGNGVMIPHGRLGGYDDILVALVRVKKPIKYEIAAIHKEDDIKYMFLILASKNKNKLVLKLMSAISKLVNQKEFLDKIDIEIDKNKILKYIKKYEKDVKDTITAEDIMIKDVERVYENETLEDVASKLVISDLPGLPVFDMFDNFIGEITPRELIEYGLPKYMSLLGDMSFLATGEPFEDYFKNENTVKVNELYRKSVLTVTRKTPIMELSYLMVTKSATRLYVVEDNKFYGMILRKDIIKKVLHI
ncbi:CBS domain signal transduction protein /PTS system IIA component (Fru family) [Hypnocyclicus thermotrophus]|uniref:CBS domain signal transduction protein /PTS system IIA component (Fru family) n=1 Tax=Hypnocyclicus thermotrophus TaxID=1627895 RepID=A0AA46DY79_9FUSO|nr:PTS sugar transporter subunit IIA [Hypnocyclicus thermotrophus]TDT69726.1 CBS domain signal transduction protein /PTS system IIA component (Fru family) [Hypnocyclicus thermotrophus]